MAFKVRVAPRAGNLSEKRDVRRRRTPNEEHHRDHRADEHTLPFTGTIKWTELVHALQDARYRGPISLEVHNSFHPLPDHLMDRAAPIDDRPAPRTPRR